MHNKTDTKHFEVIFVGGYLRTASAGLIDNGEKRANK